MPGFKHLERNLRKEGFDTAKLEEELTTLFESTCDSTQIGKAKKDDTLWEMNNCLQHENKFENISCASRILKTIFPVLQSSDITYPVTFSVIFSIFQNVSIGPVQSDQFAYRSNGRLICNAGHMQTEAVNLFHLFKEALAYLNGMSGNFSRWEIENLLNDVPNKKCTEFLWSLKTKIENLLSESSFSSAELAIVYINIYARLATLRSITLWQVYCKKELNTFGQQSAKSTYLRIEMNEKLDQEFVRFITQPKVERAVFLTVFHPSKNADFLNLLKANGIKLQTLANSGLQEGCTYTIHPSAWPSWRMEMGWDVDGSIWGTNDDKKSADFQFEPLPMEIDNIFYIRSCKWSNYYVYMRNNPWGFLAGMKGKPGPEGKWKIVKVESSYFLMSPLEWPCYFIYMTNSPWGQVRGVFGHEIKEKCHKGKWKICCKK